MKYKKLTKEQIIISLDRLTRFKKTKNKYYRVFSELILSNVISPKFKKTDIEKLDYSEISEIVSELFDYTFADNKSLNDTEYIINNKLKEYENSIYVNDSDTQKLLNNKINYEACLKYITEKSPYNLKWLKTLKNNDINVELREKYKLRYPVEKVVLVEGITEEILLPAFSKFLGYDFWEKGIHVIGAGGKSQVVKKYYELSSELKLPIFILLDKDAEENIKQIKPKLRLQDKIHLVSCGEFEDLLPKSLVVKTLNKDMANFNSVSESDMVSNLSTVKMLEEIFKSKGQHEFKKAYFAKLVKDCITERTDVSEEISAIVNEIFD